MVYPIRILWLHWILWKYVIVFRSYDKWFYYLWLQITNISINLYDIRSLRYLTLSISCMFSDISGRKIMALITILQNMLYVLNKSPKTAFVKNTCNRHISNNLYATCFQLARKIYFSIFQQIHSRTWWEQDIFTCLRPKLIDIELSMIWK